MGKEGTMTRGERRLGPVTDLRLCNGITLDIYAFNVPLRRECVWLETSKYKLAFTPPEYRGIRIGPIASA
jgi:hypothetical protein